MVIECLGYMWSHQVGCGHSHKRYPASNSVVNEVRVALMSNRFKLMSPRTTNMRQRYRPFLNMFIGKEAFIVIISTWKSRTYMYRRSCLPMSSSTQTLTHISSARRYGIWHHDDKLKRPRDCSRRQGRVCRTRYFVSFPTLNIVWILILLRWRNRSVDSVCMTFLPGL